ncbi:MAG: hypothetical protein JXQ73_10130 [Phycisphaerae bacterium]|nr:hypothetical protein [Phycisphaerae bacterium]
MAETVGARVDHFVPADKQLDPGWVKALYEKGSAPAYEGKALENIGMPVGGIAAGQVYLMGDGRLGYWMIFNKHVNTGYGKTNYHQKIPPPPVDQGFAVTVEAEGLTQTRRLDAEGFQDVRFTGQYPIGIVRYSDAGLPVRVEMEAFSPFIPLNAEDSALPATIFHITVENRWNKPVKVALLGWLENAVCSHTAGEVRGLRQSVCVKEKGRTLIVHTAQEAPKPAREAAARPPIVLADFEGDTYGDWKATGEALGKSPARGTLIGQQAVSGFLGKGLVNTFLGGDDPHGTLTSPPFEITRNYVNFLIGGGNHARKTCINLMVGRKVVRTAAGTNNERLLWNSWKVDDLAGQTATIQIVDVMAGAWGHINIDQIELSDERREGPTGPIDKLHDYGTMVLATDGACVQVDGQRDVVELNKPVSVTFKSEKADPYPIAEKKSTLTKSQSVELAPGAKKTWTAVVAWHFPNHQHGRHYATRLADAKAVAHYVLDNHDRLTTETRLWRDTYYDSTLPVWLLDRLHSTVSNLATETCQWWANGRFWAYEGVGCCEGTCTHVWNYQHALARLFPSLERSIREMQDFGDGFDAETGLVGFRSNRAYAADGQCGTILKAYREHLMSPDDAFLKRNWPKIKKALEYSIGHDGNDDGLIEDKQHNTFDIEFYGANTFIGSLYLGALRAAEEMAKEVGDDAFAQRVRRIYESGRKLTVERLWNGEYFIQDVDLKKHPKHQYGQGCLSDHLFGQGWAHLLSLGYIYPPEKVKQAMGSVYKYNWAPDVGPQNKVHKPFRDYADPGEAGLFTCTWPKSPHLDEGVMYKNEVWTGIEYQAANHMVAEGMVTEALAICRAVHERYDPAKRNPYNEVECGDHYARAMASWGVFTNLAGYEYHGPKGHLGFTPKLTPEDFRSAFTTAEGWGTFEQKRSGESRQDRITVRWGKLRLRSLSFEPPGKPAAPKVTVQVDGKPLSSKSKLEDGRLLITLGEAIVLERGQTLTVQIK